VTGDTVRIPDPADWATAQPYAMWAAARSRGPVIAVDPPPWDPRPAYIVAGRAEAEAVLRDPKTFSSSIHRSTSGRFKGETIVGMDGAEHRRYRGLVASAFRPSVLEHWRADIVAPVVHELLDRIAPAGRADLVADVTSRFPVQVICEIIGLPRADHEQFVVWAEAINHGHLDPGAGYAARDALSAYLEPIVEERRRRPAGDLLSELVTAEIDGARLSEERLYSFLRLLVPAGAETTLRAMGNCLYALLTHADARAAVGEDRSRLDAAIEETLRWETSVTMVARITTRATTIGECAIPAGAAVTVLVGAADRDPARYDDPDEWDPGRPSCPHLAFGTGPHQCLGMHLARMELAIGVAAVFDRLPALRLDPGEPPPVVAGYAFRGPDRLPVRFDPA
jgi:cytochrome P450